MNETQDFRDYTVLVTGAGVGIGYGIARAFANAGATVALNDIDGQLAHHAARTINEEVGLERVKPYPGDVADVPTVRRIVEDFATLCGRLDIAVANAGITNFGPLLEYTPEAFDRVTGVNLRGTFFTAQASARQMIAADRHFGRILLMSSVTGVQAYPNLSVYGMTKAAIRHLAAVMAVELGAHGITVNALCPGATLTERTRADDPRYAENWAGETPNRRVGLVEDIVAAALFLAAPAARHITGQTLVIDGGWTATSPIPAETPDLPEISSRLK